VRSGLLTLEQLEEAAVFDRYRIESLKHHPHLGGRRLLCEAIRRMLSAQIHDVTASTRALIEKAAPASSDDVRAQPPLVCFSSQMAVESAQLKHFLSRNLYRHPQVQDNTDRAREVVRGLFERYMAQPRDLPESAPRLPGLEAEHPQHARAVADYIAGMTDRFALREHERLTGERLFD